MQLAAPLAYPTTHAASPVRRPLFLHLLQAPVAAVHDAVRAWRIAPQFSARCEYETGARGERVLKSRRPFTPGERLVYKIRTARQVLRHGLRLRLAKQVCIRRIDDEGFMANLLHVLEVLHRIRPDTRVHIDWTLTGAERGFRYGNVGDNVWTGLFRQLAPRPSTAALCADAELDFALWGTGKDYLTGDALQRHRRRYHRTILEHVEVTNPRVRRVVSETYERSMRGRFAIGVHRRVDNAMLPNVQRDGIAPSIQDFIEHVRQHIPDGSSEWTVFLATDDHNTVPPFREAFGKRLVVRDVQRTTSDQAEVHYRDWSALSLADAEDVLIDTLLLAHCRVLVHAASSITTMAGLMNPDVDLVRVRGGGSCRTA